MAIKKAFQDIIAFLEQNSDKKVSTILDDAIALASTKTGGGASGSRTAIRSEDGTVVAILDYYFKRWMPVTGPEAVEFGKKASSNTGLNSMSKTGTAQWNKQQKDAKAALANILVEVESGDLAPDQIAARKEEIEAERNTIVTTDLGFETLEELYDYLEDEGISYTPLAS